MYISVMVYDWGLVRFCSVTCTVCVVIHAVLCVLVVIIACVTNSFILVLC